jgi:hypothetical protein
MNHSMKNLPPACNGVDPCTDLECQRAIAQTHVISEQDFQTRIITQAGPPKVLSATNIQDLLDSGNCSKDAIAFDASVESNQDLDPIVRSAGSNYINYSFPLFKGILSQSATAFSFYLATGGSGRDVIFKVDFSSQPAEYYDISSAWP